MYRQFRKDRRLLFEHIEKVSQFYDCHGESEFETESLRYIIEHWKQFLYLLKNYPFKVFKAGFNRDWLHETLFELDDDLSETLDHLLNGLIKLGYADIDYSDEDHREVYPVNPLFCVWEKRLAMEKLIRNFRFTKPYIGWWFKFKTLTMEDLDHLISLVESQQIIYQGELIKKRN